ncbi:MAG TPA: hypothetical protein VJV58_16055 [Bradyrhizobium sp.]|uniref:hypothetical protein n=1 Tax=Bradyrhizobium sp. TaxID=376 RepID=UPI002B471F8B|nr:hypothetical protein [Bradyrhizobium sp.]HKO72439.1 hypothetical protein [Bradyrhizobium sp.]
MEAVTITDEDGQEFITIASKGYVARTLAGALHCISNAVRDGKFACGDLPRLSQGVQRCFAPLRALQNPRSNMGSRLVLLTNSQIVARTIQRNFHLAQSAGIDAISDHSSLRS